MGGTGSSAGLAGAGAAPLWASRSRVWIGLSTGAALRSTLRRRGAGFGVGSSVGTRGAGLVARGKGCVGVGGVVAVSTVAAGGRGVEAGFANTGITGLRANRSR